MSRATVLLVSLLMAACGREAPLPALPPAPPAPPEAVALPPVAVNALPGRAQAWACESGEVVVLPAEDGARAWLWLPGAAPTAPRALTAQPAASGARYGGEGLVFWNKGVSATLQGEGRSLACSLDRPRGPWVDAWRRGVRLRALGQEPGWWLELGPGEALRVVTDYGEREWQTTVTAVSEGRWTAETAEGPLTVTVATAPCEDIMSGDPFGLRVEVTVGARTLQGCGDWLGAAAP